MCVVCILWNKEKLTPQQGKRALFEMAQEPEYDRKHLEEIYAELDEAEYGVGKKK